ncbi:MAG: 7TM diverse intracellular signaling domain-containing protein [Bacteroidota bacterium]|nr:7TM diverse intracellular signaling domain-containing protein [Bacteroidota bacterium]MDP4212108.1 7TM diverse intracellular signaling domain-containing protein [Bacteroidota bacterium]MDP4249498.1 7TM diverse intracellular signaling domain-containing protein [Bacteroidota bacterium]
MRFIFSLLIMPAFLFAQKRTEKDTVLVSYGFGRELSFSSPHFLADSTGSETFSQIQKDSFSVAENNFLHLMDHPSGSFRYWIKFNLSNASDSTLDVNLYSGYSDYTDLYFLSEKHPALHLQGGRLRRYHPDDALANEVSGTIPFRLLPRQKGTLYLSIVQHSVEYYFRDIELLDKNQLNAYVMADYDSDTRFIFFQALFQGFLLCQLFYVLFQWLLIRRNEYLYYFSYLLLLALYFLSKYEPLFGIHLLFTKYPVLRIYLSKTFLILPYFFYYRFVRSFLEMPSQYPRLNRWIVKLEYFLLCYSLFDFLFIVISFNQRMQALISTFVLIATFIISASFIVYMFRRRKALVNYILTGSFFVGLGSIIGTIFTFMSDNLHLDTGVTNIMIYPQMGIILEICCFTAGLSYKSQASEKEKIRGQQELIEQLKANELLQTRLQHIRNKIAQDLHDDIGSTLSSISILSGLAIKEKDSELSLHTIAEINAHSMLLMERMDDIVWSINPRNDTLENLMTRVKHFATSLFEAQNIDYEIQIQSQISLARIPMEYRQHIYLILKEAINNLVKYAHASMAGINIWFDDRHLTMEVRDNGRGFDALAQYRGNGIYGMRKRAQQMNASLELRSDPQTGTVLTLTVPFS